MMSGEKQESQQYPVDAIHYYPKDKRLVIEVEGGVTFALTQNPEGLFAQLLLNQVSSQRAAVLQDDAGPATETKPGHDLGYKYVLLRWQDDVSRGP